MVNATVPDARASNPGCRQPRRSPSAGAGCGPLPGGDPLPAGPLAAAEAGPAFALAGDRSLAGPADAGLSGPELLGQLHVLASESLAGDVPAGDLSAPALWARFDELVSQTGPREAGTSGYQAEAGASHVLQGQVLHGPGGTTVAAGQAGIVAQAALTAGAQGRFQDGPLAAEGAATVGAEVRTAAVAQGMAVKTHKSVMVAGSATAEALAKVEGAAAGRLEVGKELLDAAADVSGAASTGVQAKAAGMAYLGIDSLGLPAFNIQGGAEGSAGAEAQGEAGATVSLLGLVKLHIGAVANAIAGAAGGALVHLEADNGIFALALGATGAAGVGGHLGTEVGVELGPLPKGILMTTVSPILEAPELLVSSIAKLLGIVKSKPGRPVPGITDYPQIAGKTIVTGARLVAQGARTVADDVVDTGVAIGHGVATGATFVGKTVAGAAVGIAKGVASGVGAIGGFFSHLF